MKPELIAQTHRQLELLEVNSKQKNILYRLLEEEEVNKMENLAMNTLDEPNGRKRKKLFNAVKGELYRLLCTDEGYYNPERSKVVGNIELLVPALAGTIATAIGIAAGVITALVAALLMIILKVGRQAWCKAQKE